MGFDLTPSSSVAFVDGGRFGGKAMSAGYAYTAGVTGAAPFTIDMWCKFPGIGGVMFACDIDPWWGVDGGYVTGSGGYNCAGKVDDGAWHHIAFVVTGSEVRQYIDGIYKGGSSAGGGGSSKGMVLRAFGPGGGNTAPTGILTSEVLVRSGARYTGATCPVPTAKWTGAEDGRLALWRLDGDVLDAGAGGAPALSIGALAATPGLDRVTLSLAAGLAGGSGAGYAYDIYRGTTPDFDPVSAAILKAGATLPYDDTTVTAGTDYYFAVLGRDSAGSTVPAIPKGIGGIARQPAKMLYTAARLLSGSIALVCGGNSITFGDTTGSGGSVTENTPPAAMADRLRRLGGLRRVQVANCGLNGGRLADFQPGGSDPATMYHQMTAAMTTFLAADPAALPLFSLMFGTNESGSYGGRLTPAQYKAAYKPIVDALLADFPGAKVMIHDAIWYSPNTQGAGGTVYEQDGLARQQSYRPATDDLVASYATSAPGRVLRGDTTAYAYFETNYLTDMSAQASDNGQVYIHPNPKGATALGAIWGLAAYNALFLPRRFTLVAA